MNFNLIVTGTAEQPVFWTANILKEIAIQRGYLNVKFSGSPEARAGKGVMAQVKWGENCQSPIVSKGDCQLVLGLEPLEAIRVTLNHYTPNMSLYSVHNPLAPTSVTHHGSEYPDLEETFSILNREGVLAKLVDVTQNIDDKEKALTLLKDIHLQDQLISEDEELKIVLEHLGEEQLLKQLPFTSRT